LEKKRNAILLSEKTYPRQGGFRPSPWYSGLVDGVIVVDKPEGLTSHDVVNRLRRLANTRKVGHLGTLDPMATGVLPLVLGRATRLAKFFSSGEKTYDAMVQFGWATDTYDREGSRMSEPVAPHFTRAELEAALAGFRGTILQTPPPFSAKKIAGTPAYRLARKHIAVELEPVEVQVFTLHLAEFDGTIARICVRCSAGTYLRGIAHDVGQQLGCGAFLTALRRTMSGEFTESHARTLESLEELARGGAFEQALIPAVRVLPEIPNVTVDAVTAGQIRQGKDFRLSPFIERAGSKYVKAVGPEGDLIAIGEARLPNLYHPMLVL
jgi:tRNA pseudouridine55 synthase